MDILIITMLICIMLVFLFACSIGFIFLGKLIDDYPVENEKPRTRGLGSPKESTRIAAVVSWILMIPGIYLIIQTNTVAFVMGIVTIFGVCLFMGVAFIFAFAVLKAMSNKGKEVKEPSVRKYPLHMIPKIQKYPRDEP